MINYAEGIANINFTGNMVKIDYAVQEHTAVDKDGKPALRLSQRIVMPLDAFLQSYQVQEQLVRQLVERGVVTRVEEGAVTPAVEAPQPVEIKAD